MFTTVGDTALKIAEQSKVPVILVRREERQRYSRVLGCTKGVKVDALGWPRSAPYLVISFSELP